MYSFSTYKLYPYGSLMPNRHGNAGDGYRYGFGGQEADNEVAGEGNSYTAEFWQYDSRLGRRWNIDPVVKEHESSYACFANNPVWFRDPNGADTSNYTNAIKDAKYAVPMGEVNKSETFNAFFQSFVDGSNKDIKLEFQAVDDLKSFDTGADLDGQVLLMYTDASGKTSHVVDLGTIPPDAVLSDFKILVQLNPAGDYSAGMKDYTHAVKGVTMVHEMFVHALSATNLINDSRGADGSFDGKKLVDSYKASMGKDHELLYAGKNWHFVKVSNEIINKQSSMITTDYVSSDVPTVKNWENQYGPTSHDGKLARMYLNQLWRFVFDINMNPLSPTKTD